MTERKKTLLEPITEDEDNEEEEGEEGEEEEYLEGEGDSIVDMREENDDLLFDELLEREI